MHNPKITIQIPETPNDKIGVGAKPRASMLDAILQDPKEKMMELGKEEEKAIPFISYDVKKGFVIGEEAEAFLNCLDEETLIGIICIVGKYRTGKSFFTNRVLLGKEGGQKGFQVGPTVNPCTKVKKLIEKLFFFLIFDKLSIWKFQEKK